MPVCSPSAADPQTQVLWTLLRLFLFSLSFLLAQLSSLHFICCFAIDIVMYEFMLAYIYTLLYSIWLPCSVESMMGNSREDGNHEMSSYSLIFLKLLCGREGHLI